MSRDVTHRYVGPSTIWGLEHNCTGTVEGKKFGCRRFKRGYDGKRFLVPARQLEAIRR